MLAAIGNKIKSLVFKDELDRRGQKRQLDGDNVDDSEETQSSKRIKTTVFQNIKVPFSKVAEWIVKKKQGFNEAYYQRPKHKHAKSKQYSQDQPSYYQSHESTSNITYRDPTSNITFRDKKSTDNRLQTNVPSHHHTNVRFKGQPVITRPPYDATQYTTKTTSRPPMQADSISRPSSGYSDRRSMGQPLVASTPHPNLSKSIPTSKPFRSVYDKTYVSTPRPGKTSSISEHRIPITNGRRHLSRSNSGMSTMRQFTAYQSVDLEEKERFQQLLQQVTNTCLNPESYQHISIQPTRELAKSSFFSDQTLLGSDLASEKSVKEHDQPSRLKAVPRKQLNMKENIKQDDDITCIGTSGHVIKHHRHRDVLPVDDDIICIEDHTTRAGTTFSPFKKTAPPGGEHHKIEAANITHNRDRGDKDDLEIIEVKRPVVSGTPSSFKIFQEALQMSPYCDDSFMTNFKEDFERSFSIRDIQVKETEIKSKVLQEERHKRDKALEQRIRQQMRISGKLPAVIDDPYFSESEEESIPDEEEDEFPELDEAIQQQIDDALVPVPPNEVLVDAFRISLTRKDINTLNGLNWLNDEIINFYLTLIQERGNSDDFPRVHSFNTFFYTKLCNQGYAGIKRWTKKTDIFAVDYIVIPVHLGMHWCLAVIDFKLKRIRYFDSMGGRNQKCLDALRNYLDEEHKAKKGSAYDFSGWHFVCEQDIPQQMNGSDCGMFACKYAEFVTREAPIIFTQEHISYFRRRMVYELISKQLM